MGTSGTPGSCHPVLLGGTQTAFLNRCLAQRAVASFRESQLYFRGSQRFLTDRSVLWQITVRSAIRLLEWRFAVEMDRGHDGSQSRIDRDSPR
jgi:hypothetical protein